MSFVRGLGAALVALACITGSLAADYPNEAQLRGALENVAGLLEAEGFTVEVLDAQKEGVTRPLMAAGLSLKTGACLVFYNTKPLEALRLAFATIPDKDFPLWLNAIAVHELAHCVEQREAYLRRRFDKVLPPGYSRDRVTLQSYLAMVKSGAVERWGEALADITAVLYFQEVVPQDWKRLAGAFADMRERMGEKYPAHNTAAWLRSMIAENAARAPGQNLFDAAFALRARLAPEPQSDDDEAPNRQLNGAGSS